MEKCDQTSIKYLYNRLRLFVLNVVDFELFPRQSAPQV